jgi:hypothetical protein
VLTLAVLLFTGCTSEGLAVPVGGAYMSRVTSDETDRAESFMKARTLDPCGFLNLATIEKIGTPFITTPRSLDVCEVTVLAQDGQTTLHKIILTMGVAPVGKTETYDESTAETDDLGTESCSSTVRFDEWQYFMIMVFPFRDATESACSVTKKLIESTIPLLSSRPQREDGPDVNKIPLADADPCVALGHIPLLTEKSSVSPQLTSCTMRNTGKSTSTTISHHLSTTHAIDNSWLGEIPLWVLDIPANEIQRSSDYCEVDVFVGHETPIRNVQAPPGSDTKYVETVTARAVDCPRARAAAVEAVRALQK